MNCPICFRVSSSRLRFYCPTCACNQLYTLRIDNARVLLEKEILGRQLEKALLHQTSPTLSHRRSEECSTQSPNKVPCPQDVLQIINAKAESSTRRKELALQIQQLKSEIKDRQLGISQRRLTLARRRSDAESSKFQLESREIALLCGVQNTIKRTEHLWHSLHSKTAEARIFLCREVANLYSLRQWIKQDGSETKETYVIGSVPIIDLRDLNGATAVQISTSFSNIAHLLVLVSHYLSLRLPAEITLPHRDHPVPTIHAPIGSYTSRQLILTATSAQPHNPTSSTAHPLGFQSNHYQPRPLTIDRSLPKLAREDPGSYVLFLEGVTLLAWNVSWLCRTQGLNIASDSWEEICDIGKNMWQLLVAPPLEAATLMRAFAGRETQPMKLLRDPPRTSIQRTISFPMMGHYSHGTVHSFLGASEGTEFVRTWRLPIPLKVIDKLKSMLLGEMASAEWEVLEEKEWNDSEQISTRAPAQGSRSQPGDDVMPDKNYVSHLASASGGPNELDSTSRPRGSSGWTKLRNR
ncbi:Atg14 domain-containing protein [Aspergillus novofumigatus IBT 16806]|uniref:Autophagy-related protein 14 n=1 Tax=Aspergillus novofumigatus (strain IBT 16806) TaxID=1392255 RepID=A0A2I1BZX4_ASPN1|nr:uncharacterized protein P174DRAFT_514888 [Aspergillus novofumigatus IBT 16806]PKX90901.1 hypothetical protein P174DRAFT_514888 [Aspergillus novofumigatus IBT 16806]